jgi:hypothetical protein
MSNRILLDTTSYLRLAFVIDPLLRQPFDKDGTELFVLPELDREYKRSPRLRNEFAWVADPQYVQNRRDGRLLIRDPQKGEINGALEIMTFTAETAGKGVSPIDIKCLACGYVLNIQVVTDDMEMRSLADEFHVATLTSLELLKRMVGQGYKKQKQIDDIIKYWNLVDDLPPGWRGEYKELFGSEPPPSL